MRASLKLISITGVLLLTVRCVYVHNLRLPEMFKLQWIAVQPNSSIHVLRFIKSSRFGTQYKARFDNNGRTGVFNLSWQDDNVSGELVLDKTQQFTKDDVCKIKGKILANASTVSGRWDCAGSNGIFMGVYFDP